nr:choice-of-anchor tandem repeat GloVer-containing protein [Nevskia soli]
MIQGTDGNFYGTTANGGTYNEGTVFQMTPVGRLTTLHSFCAPGAPSCTDGNYPNASLLQATTGEFYGTDTGGGYSSSSGTVFSLNLGLGPFVRAQQASGRAGDLVIILGTDLAGTTSVTFNGTPAAYRVVSKSEIGATIPAGAASGRIAVVAPKGIAPFALLSNVPFHVTEF